MIMSVASGLSRVMTISEMSAAKESASGCPSTDPAATARPAIFASPGHSASLPVTG